MVRRTRKAYLSLSHHPAWWKKCWATSGISTSRLSRMGFPPSIVSSTASSRAPFLDPPGDSIEVLCPLLGFGPRPPSEGGAGRGDGGIDIGGIRLHASGEHGFSGWIDRVKGLAAATSDETAPMRGDIGRRCQDRLARGRARIPIRCWLSAVHRDLRTSDQDHGHNDGTDPTPSAPNSSAAVP